MSINFKHLFCILSCIYISVYPQRERTIQVVTLKHFQNFPKLFETGLTKNFLNKLNVLQTTLKKSPREHSYNIIENLSALLAPFAQAHCLIVLDDFVGVFNINPPTQHVTNILRRPIIGFQQTNFTGVWENKLAWLPSTFPKIYIGNKTNWFSNCPFSPFFLGDAQYDLFDTQYCLGLSKKKLTLGSKPWNCQAQISLFPPNFLVNNFKVNTTSFELGIRSPLVFRDLTKIPHLKTINPLPSLVPKFHVYVIAPEEFNELYSWDSVWQSHANEQNLHYFAYHDIVLLSQTQLYNGRIAGQHWKITGLKIYCPQCTSRYLETNYWSVHFERTLEFQNFLTSGFSLLLSGSNFYSNTQQQFQVHGHFFEDSDETLGGFLRHMDDCKNFLQSGQRASTIFRFSRTADRVAHAYAHVWMSIMRNYTYSTTEGSCTNGVLHTRRSSHTQFFTTLRGRFYLGHNVHMYHMFIEDILNGLQFISCKNSRQNELSYQQLFYVFDLFTWIGIVISCLTLHSSFVFITKHTKTCQRNWFALKSILKTLLEQGSPFPRQILSGRLSLKVLVMTSFTGAIVLSNAYKNKNVRSLILPIPEKPYGTFAELIQNNISVYTRSSNIWFSPYEFTDWSALKISQSQHKLSVTSQNKAVAGLQSEVAVYGFAKAVNVENLTEFEELVYNTASLHPSLTGVVYKLKQTLTNSSSLENVPSKKEELKHFIAEEEEVLTNTVKKCDNVAIVLPRYLCHQFVNTLRRYNTRNFKRHLVGVGNETYFKGYHIYELTGYTNIGLVRRMKWISQSGIMEWWGRLVNSGVLAMADKTSEESNDLGRPNMNGNIIVIFHIFLMGSLFAMLGFVMELLNNLRTTYNVKLRSANQEFLNRVKFM